MAMYRNKLQTNISNNTTTPKTHCQKTSHETPTAKPRNQMHMVWKNIQCDKLFIKTPKIRKQNTTWPIGTCPIKH